MSGTVNILHDENELVGLLVENNMSITTAESCTGGMISSTLVNVPGASSVLDEAYVTYANKSKIKLLGVKAETLAKYGAVSEQTAFEMAYGAAMAAASDVAISVTGTAGPDGGTEDKPVGTVYAGFYVKGKVNVIRYNFDGDRYNVRKKTTEAVISQMADYIKKTGA